MLQLKKIIYFFATFVLTIGSLLSCDSSYLQRPLEPYEWQLDPTKVRLAYSTIEINDFLELLNVKEYNKDTNGNIYFSYNTSFNVKNENLIDLSISDQNYYRQAVTPVSSSTFTKIGGSPYTIPAGSTLANDIPQKKTEENIIDVSENLSGALFETGVLTIQFNSTFDCEIDLIITIPSISSISSEQIFNDFYTINKGPNLISIPLKEYKANFTHNGTEFDKNTFNNFVIITERIFKFKEGNTIREDDKIDIHTKISNINTEVIFGDFGTKKINFAPQSIELDFFEELQEYNISFANPQMTINASNDYGFPIGIDVTNFEATTQSSSVFLNYDGISEDEKLVENLLIFEGIEKYSESITSKKTKRIINKDNSNLRDLIEINPTELKLNLVGEINPVDKNPNTNFYSNNNNNLNVDLSIDIPMDINFKNVVIEENINIDLSIIPSQISYTKIDVVTNNSLPLSGEIELRFLKNGKNLNINKQKTVFQSAIIDNTGKSIQATENTTTFEFKGEEISKLRQARQIQILLTLNTPTGKTSVRIENSNKLDVILKSEFAGKFNFSN